MDEAAAEATSFAILYVGSGLGSCMTVIFLLYNAAALVGHLRADTTEKASGTAKAAWAISALGLVLPPCGLFFALIGVILGVRETGLVYREASPLASLTPARMAKTNGGVILVLQVLVGMSAVATFAM